jgi:polyisoprenoid-binding protein YceI
MTTTAQANSISTWAPDLNHSEVTFKVKHMMISTVSGRFNEFNVEVNNFDGIHFEESEVRFSAETASVNTSNDQRDAHLRSGDFFDADNFPQLTFQSTGIEKKSDQVYEISGDLNIRGTVKNIRLQAEFGGVLNDPWGNAKAGFTLEGKINRTDFGLNWNAALEAGGWLVAEEVKLNAEIQLAGQAS